MEKRMKSVNKKQWAFLVSAGVLFVLLITLSSMFPLSGDDWYWGSKDFSFENITSLNGRYLGSLIVLIMTHVNWLRVLITAVTVFGIIYFSSRAIEKNAFVYFIFSALLILLMSKDMFRQVIVWSSAFSNYSPSALIMTAYLCIAFKSFSSRKENYHKYTFILTGALGFCGALFMENMTIGNVIIALAIIIYSAIRFKSVDKVHIAFLIGCISGAVLMFIDPAYLGIFGGSDKEGYRDVAINVKSIIGKYFNEVHQKLIYENIYLNAALFILVFSLVVKRFREYKSSEKIINILSLLFEILFLIISVFENFSVYLIPQFKYTGVVKGMLSALFFIGLILNYIFAIKDTDLKLKLIFLCGSITAYTLPLLVVNPIGARNFFETYILFVVMALLLLQYNLKIYEAENTECLLVKLFCVIAIIAVISLFVYYIIIYSTIASAYTEMLTLLYEQLNSDCEIIVLNKLPYGDYIWHGDPIQENIYLQNVFKEYYGISKDISLIIK